ncbi:ROK family transcriptional regulator [Oharaeibacter diazotrophicus]|uniref:Putative NBD/HSP70 family sugar kinase n=3 Tax=Oharaeibacter diazotrophicus TaxID=1920512 RepID=A0A4R6RL63_9HYPH|nr:ROK family transcriptional regulator [Oharaeibacter diazotrophicus]TDP87222.1 putative NBD/HSP70 family sugar kinase [Oharaeibacter diazotrophicus]BBE70835.1 glucokinase [Pleomorphomonas sp. SM30]GLS77584.1 sugar kinase [Oharaeibacter diazotrophicus]
MALDDGAPPVLRQISVRAVMDVLLHRGATSRADLAQITGLSKQTMSQVIRTLEEAGWVRVKGVTTGRIGRAPVAYEVAAEAGYVIGADLGATNVRVAIADIVGNVVGAVEMPSDPRGGRDLVARLDHLKTRLLADCGVDPARVLDAVVATPGVIDPATGTLALAPNVAGLGDFDFAAALRDVMAVDVVIENDVNAAAIGESWCGCAVGVDDMAFVSLGTGIGLGALVGGRLLRGAGGAAGEISYLPFGADPAEPESLDRGALERALGAAGIRERYRELGGTAGLQVRDIFARAAQGDAAAAATAAEAARNAALLVVAVAALLDPAKVVLGGNIGRHPLMADLIRRELPRLSRRPVPIDTSILGQRATLFGAIAIALNAAHNRLFSPQDLPKRMRLPPAPAGGAGV